MKNKNLLIVFIKYPRPGHVKTRLACDVGKDKAAAIYRAFLQDMKKRLRKVEPFCDTVLYCDPSHSAEQYRQMLPGGCIEMQEGRDLGARMKSAIASGLDSGYERVVIIGSDVPHLCLDDIEEAFERLKKADVVIGPCDDGGYWLIGALAAVDVFTGVPWSCEDTYKKTMEKAREQGLSVSILPVLFDIDDVDDLRRLDEVLKKDKHLALELPLTVKEMEGIFL